VRDKTKLRIDLLEVYSKIIFSQNKTVLKLIGHHFPKNEQLL